MWPNPQFSADLVTFTGEIFNGNFSFCAVPAEIIRSWLVLENLTIESD